MRYRKRKCRCCRQWFLPQAHNAYHQRYCTEPDCRAASRRRSQRKWLRKNPDQNRGPENVMRVRTWREEHPGYWRNTFPREHVRLDLFVSRGPATSGMRLRGEHRNTGALQELFPSHPVTMQRITTALEGALRGLIGALLPRWYVGLETTGG